MKRLIALALILGFTSAAVYAMEADCKPGQDPTKDHCKKPHKNQFCRFHPALQSAGCFFAYRISKDVILYTPKHRTSPVS